MLAITALLALVLLVLSLAEACMNALGAVGLRVLAEEDESNRLLKIAGQDRDQVAVPLQFAIQIIQISVAILVTAILYRGGLRNPPATALLIMIAVVLVFRQFLPRVISHSNPERIFRALLPSLRYFYMVARPLSFPLMAGLKLSENLQKDSTEEEVSEEEIEAFIDVGEQQGIFEQDASKMIQSVVEFSDTLVGEVMTPRTSVIAVPENTTLSKLRQIMVDSRHSRIPVYKERIDNIVGIAYVRQLIAHLDGTCQDQSVREIVQRAYLVPESKYISELLREFQKKGEHMALVFDEFGALSGLVTLEDVLEEIVGEIRDEDQQLQTEIVEEEDSFLAKGITEIHRIEELFGLELSDEDSNTISGLIVNHLGHVPPPGSVFELSGLNFHIAQSDRRSIQSVRVFKHDVEKARKAQG
ncbi:MAG: hemolysin family protein [Acidobacteriota bacterium]